jgi:YD repeat-containing protein
MDRRDAAVLLLAVIWGVIEPPGMFAIVDMRNANYAETWVDIEIEGAGLPVSVERAYNSRSLYQGKFGFGWCSDYETSLRAYPDGSLLRTECGAGYEETFVPTDYSVGRVNELVTRIVDAQRKVLTWRDEAYFAEQSQLLRSDARLRRRWSDRFGWAATHREGTRFKDVGGRDASVEYTGGVYSFTRGGSVERFNAGGQLTGRLGRNGIWQTLSYDGKSLRTVSYSTGESFEFTSSKNGRIERITASNGKLAKYGYDERGDLVRVTNGWGNTYLFKYDHLRNLVEIAYPDNTTKRLTYDTDKDWVIAYEERDGCKESYEYTVTDRNTYRSTVRKVCGGKVVNRSSYEFWYKPGSIDKYMSRVRTVSNDRVTDVTYHETLQRPTRIVRDGATEEYEYATDGRLMAWRAGGRVLKITYDSRCSNHLTQADEGDLQTFYRYDDRCDLVLIRDTNGARVTFAHDTATALVSAVDETGASAVLFKNADGQLMVAPEKQQSDVAAAKRVAALLYRARPSAISLEALCFRGR